MSGWEEMVKKVKSGVIMILIGLFLTGCGGSYNAEKLLWKANQKANKIFSDPKATPEGQYIEAIDFYKKVIVKYPKTLQAGEARFKMGLLYMAKEDFKTAEEMFRKILDEHPDKINLCANAQFNIGSCYEKGGNWEQAYAEYKKAFNNYSKTLRGLHVPYYIADYYQQKKKFLKAEKEFKEAVEIYKKLVKENPGTPLAYAAQGYIVLCFENQKKWNESINALQVLYDNYPDTPGGANALVTMGMIYQKQLNQPQKAIQVYEKYIEKYPKSKIISTLKSAIKHLKSENIEEPTNQVDQSSQ